MLRDIDCGLIACAPGRDLRVGAEVNAAAQERAGREDHGASAEGPPIGRDDAGGVRAVEQQPGDHSLRELDAGEVFEEGSHRAPVQRTVALRAGGPDRRPLRAIEHTELDRGAIGRAAHDPAKGVDLAHDGALGDPADGGIAR